MTVLRFRCMWTLCLLVFELFCFTWLHSTSEVFEHIHSCFYVFKTDCFTNRLVREVFFIPSCETPLLNLPFSLKLSSSHHLSSLSDLLPNSLFINHSPHSLFDLVPFSVYRLASVVPWLLWVLSSFSLSLSFSFSPPSSSTYTPIQKKFLHVSSLTAMLGSPPLMHVWVTGFKMSNSASPALSYLVVHSSLLLFFILLACFIL